MEEICNTAAKQSHVVRHMLLKNLQFNIVGFSLLAMFKLNTSTEKNDKIIVKKVM